MTYAPCCSGALGLKQEEKAAYAPYCPEALGLETLSLEKAAFPLCSPGGLRLEGFEREEESLMDECFEQASAYLK
jgi:hypothetical protein